MTDETEAVNPRTVFRGDVIVPKGWDKSEAVRSVSIVLHLANGQDEVYTTDETVSRLVEAEPDRQATLDALAEEEVKRGLTFESEPVEAVDTSGANEVVETE